MGMVSMDEALRRLLGAVRTLGPTDVELAQARGRVLAETVHADRDFPPTDRSAMDGYAVRADDLSEPGRELRIVGESRAGRPLGDLEIDSGEAGRIYTGALVPPGADTVVMVERTERRPPDHVRIGITPEPGAHIRGRGTDLRAGDVVLEAGAVIDAPEIAALASVGHTRVRVFRSPDVHLLSTGDEVVEAEVSPLEHQIRNSNAPMLAAQLAELGLEGEYLGVAPDEREALERLLRRGLAADLLLITGGVSVGDYDLVGQALEDAGLDLLFHKVALKPGKPILAGRLGDCLVIGLPGNPVSAYVGFALFVAPALRRMMGRRRWANVRLSAELAQPLRRKPGRETLHLARFEFHEGKLVGHSVRSTGSGDVLSMVRANGFLITPADAGEQPAGTILPALLWRDFHLR